MLLAFRTSIWRAMIQVASNLKPSDQPHDILHRDAMSITPHDVLRLTYPHTRNFRQEASQ
jgi:hypothetical protein